MTTTYPDTHVDFPICRTARVGVGARSIPARANIAMSFGLIAKPIARTKLLLVHLKVPYNTQKPWQRTVRVGRKARRLDDTAPHSSVGAYVMYVQLLLIVYNKT